MRGNEDVDNFEVRLNAVGKLLYNRQPFFPRWTFVRNYIKFLDLAHQVLD
jgi:hypothetical protein